MENKNFRVVFTLRELYIAESQVQEAKALRISIEDQTKTAQIPLSSSLLLDANIVSANPMFEIAIENGAGDVIAYGELAIPEEIHKTVEYEIKSLLTLNNVSSDKSPIQAEIITLFINKILIRDQQQIKLSTNTSGGESPSKNVKSRVNIQPSGQYSPVRSSSPRKNSSRSPTRAKTVKDKDLYNAYLQKLVEKHTVDVMGIVKDHKDINETIALNKKAGTFVDPNLSMSVIVEKETVEFRDSAKISVTWDDVSPSRKATQDNGIIPSEILGQRDELDLNRTTSLGDSPSKRKKLEGMTETERAWESAQVENLKKVIFELDLKCKEVDALKEENELLKEQLKKTEENQHELRLSIEETAKELKVENDANQNQIQNLMQERSSLAEKIRELNQKLEEASNTNKKLELQNGKLQNELQEAQAEAKRRGDVYTQLSTIQLKLIESEKQRNGQIATALKRFEEADVHVNESRMAFNAVLKDNEQLKQELLEAQTLLNQEKKLTFDLTHEVTLLNQKLQYFNGIQQLFEAQKSQRDELLEQLADAHTNNAALNKKIEELKTQIATANRQREVQDKAQADEVALLKKILTQTEEKNTSLIGDVNQSLKTIADLKSKISVLEQFLCAREDLNRQLDQTKKRLSKALLDRDQAIENLAKMTNSHQELNEQILELNRGVKELNLQIKDRDDYVSSLKKVIVEIREGNPLYIPVKGDPVDNALADYINSLNDPGKVKFLFVRESEGVYQFGSKKIFVKAEGDKVQIRVGGGFMGIEDFLEQNVPIELSKLASKDPVKLLQKNIQLHKTLAGRAVNQMQKTTTAALSYKPITGKSIGDLK